VGATERRAAQWAVQVLVPVLVAALHPSAGGLASTGLHAVLGCSALLATGLRLRLLARASALLVVLQSGIDPAHLLGALAQVLVCGLETAVLIGLLSLLRGHRTLLLGGRHG